MMWEFHGTSPNNDQPPLMLCDKNDKKIATVAADHPDGDMKSQGDAHKDDMKIKICGREPSEMLDQMSDQVLTEEGGQNIAKMLTSEEISKYFYMPITQAAKALNVGLTFLKRRCRELGIRRWPQQKLRSINALINSVKEVENKGKDAKKQLREAVMILERQKKLMEESLDLQLTENMKRLRQACFKANYNKRRINTGDSR